MEQVKPYVVWIGLGVALIALAVIRFGPVAAIYGQVSAQEEEARRKLQEVARYNGMGEALPRVALVERTRELADTYDRIQAGREYKDALADYQSEFWPAPPEAKNTFIDFSNPPKGTELSLKLTNLRIAQQAQASEVAESILYTNADPTQGQHLIRVPVPERDRDLSSGAEAGLPEILGTQRLLWLRKALFQIVTNPAADVKVVDAIESGLADPKDVGFPGVARTDPYVTLNWRLVLEVPFDRIPVLLNLMALSKRHLRVMDMGIEALPETVIDYRGESPKRFEAEAVEGRLGGRGGRGEEEGGRVGAAVTDPAEAQRRLEQAKFRTGRLVRVTLVGVSYDFLFLLEDKGERWPT